MERLLVTVRTVLTSTPARWQALEGLPIELLKRPPAPNEWSALDCLQHLIEVGATVFPARVEALLAGRDFAAFDPNAQRNRPADGQSIGDAAMGMVAEFVRLRTAGLEMFSRVQESDLTRTGRHATLGMMTMEEVLSSWAAHDLNHTVQAERAVMQPLIMGSGALRFRFKDHDVSG